MNQAGLIIIAPLTKSQRTVIWLLIENSDARLGDLRANVAKDWRHSLKD
jgi:hypothetical protein